MKYYIQRHASGYVGNCLLWWRKGGHGYTCDLNDAEIFDGDDDSFKDIADNNSKYTAWEKEYIDSSVERHISSESVDFKRKGIIKKED